MNNHLPLCIRHILEQTGWTQHEVSVYSSLLEKGAMDLSRISTETNIGVSSVQYALRKIHSRKMVKKCIVNRKPRWKAQGVHAMYNWLIEYSEQFRRNEETVQDFISQYDFDCGEITANVEFFEGTKAVQASLTNLRKKCLSTEVFVVISLERDADSELVAFMQKEHIALRSNKDVTVKKLVSGDSRKMGKGSRSMTNTPHLFQGMLDCANAVLHITGKTVHLTRFTKGASCAFIIEYEPMAILLRDMFQCLWDANGY